MELLKEVKEEQHKYEKQHDDLRENLELLDTRIQDAEEAEDKASVLQIKQEMLDKQALQSEYILRGKVKEGWSGKASTHPTPTPLPSPTHSTHLPPKGGTEKYLRAKTEKIQTYTQRIAALSKQEEGCVKACADLQFQLELLQTLQADRARVLRMRFEKNANNLTEDMLNQVQKLVRRLRASDIGKLASDEGRVSTLADALGGERPGLQDFLAESNREIEDVMKDTERVLRSAGEGKDALYTLAETQRMVSWRERGRKEVGV